MLSPDITYEAQQAHVRGQLRYIGSMTTRHERGVCNALVRRHKHCAEGTSIDTAEGLVVTLPHNEDDVIIRIYIIITPVYNALKHC